MIYVGDLIRYKVLADQICDFFHLDLEWKEDLESTTDDDVVYPWFLWDIKGKLVAPNPTVAQKWDNKIYQFEYLKNVVPVPSFQVLDLPRLVISLRYMEKAFITKENSLSGEGNMMYEENPQEVIEAFRGEKVLRLSEYIPHVMDVSLHIIVSRDDLFISPICEQIIEGTSFRGGRFPCFLDEKVTSTIHEYSERIADVLRAHHYIGLCGIDYMVCENGDVYLCELNPRKMGTTPFVSMQMELDGDIPLSCLEYYACILDVLPDVTVNEPTIEWELRLLPYQEGLPKFTDREYFKQEGTVLLNENYTKHSFQISQKKLSDM